jgi:hypothetical protein
VITTPVFFIHPTVVVVVVVVVAFGLDDQNIATFMFLVKYEYGFNWNDHFHFVAFVMRTNSTS